MRNKARHNSTGRTFVRGWRSAVAALAVVVVAGLGVTACTIDRSTARETEATQETPEPKPAPEVSVRNNATGVNPKEPVTVQTQDTALRSVTMVNEEGYEVESELSADKKSWTSAETLGYNRTYTVTATDENGTTTKSTFSTITPAAQMGVALSPLEGSTVGVAQTIGFRFGDIVQDRKAAEAALTVKTEPAVEGAFYWLSPYEVRWRPAEFWQPGTKVSVKADIYGKNLGNGVYGSSDNATTFTIGDDVRTIIDDATKTMTAKRGDEVLRTIPVSLGRDVERWATPNGYYIIGDKYDSLLMDSSTFGYSIAEGGYKTEVDYATQMSYSGIYVHAAPWSVAQQGNTNTSHGCVNVTTEAAQWFQNTVKRGDPVLVQNTVGGVLNGADGLGDWNIDWETWKAGNA